MPKSSHQKLKLLYLMKILNEQTDETHALSVQEMITALARYEIKAERKSIYDDLDALQAYGFDLVCHTGKVYTYSIGSRAFELPELKLMVDAVQSSKFITRKKSMELIKKLESLASINDARQLQRQVYVANRVKTFNENIYYNVDRIHEAIAENIKITFQYFEWTVTKKKQLRHDGQMYNISPWALTWDDENYYLIGFDDEAGKIKHFRVDKMLKIALSEEKRKGQEHFKEFDLALYAKKTFGMFGGGEEDVTLDIDNSLVGVIIDRFGKDVSIHPIDSDHFSVSVKVAVSPLFLAWLFGFGTKVKVINPETLKKKMLNLCHDIIGQYE
jgi:predicted DNA-binding transcriptional regulator YafY